MISISYGHGYISNPNFTVDSEKYFFVPYNVGPTSCAAVSGLDILAPHSTQKYILINESL